MVFPLEEIRFVVPNGLPVRISIPSLQHAEDQFTVARYGFSSLWVLVVIGAAEALRALDAEIGQLLWQLL